MQAKNFIVYLYKERNYYDIYYIYIATNYSERIFFTNEFFNQNKMLHLNLDLQSTLSLENDKFKSTAHLSLALKLSKVLLRYSKMQVTSL